MPDDTSTMFAPLTPEEEAAAAPASPGKRRPPTEAEKVEISGRLFGEAVPDHDALDRYLCEARGIPKPAEGWSAAVRFHPSVPYSFATGRHLPAVLMQKTTGGLHAVFLAKKGTGKANVPTPKKSFGSGGVVVIRGEGETVLACEGPEDALSLTVAVPEAAVICTAGAGTLHRVAEHLTAGAVRVVLVADRDDAGRAGAEKAAAAVHEAGVPVAIAVPPDGCKDANELLRRDGLEAVRAMVDAAEPWGPTAEEGGEATGPPPAVGGFMLRQTGLFWRDPDPEKDDILLSGPFEVVAEARDTVGGGWSVVLVWKDHDGREHEWVMPRAMLAGDGTDYRRAFLDGGLYVAPGRKARELLTSYLASVRTAARATCVDRTGWQGRVYVAANRSFGNTEGERILLQGAGAATEAKPRGTLEGWQTEVAAPCVGNSRLAFALSAAFAGPLLYLLNAESGMVHFRGASSIGKSSALYVAASAWGCPVHNWRATDNAAESLARAANDALLCLDEMGQGEARAVNAMGYMFTNGSGKARMNKDTSARPIATWRLIGISSGEIGLAEKVAEAGQRAKAGQEVRILDIPADAGAGLGAFERLHGSVDGDAFARRIRLATETHRGHAAHAFLERITAGDLDELAAAVRAGVERWKAAHVPAGADGQVQRAAGRFALIAAAGELAATMGILPWPEGEAELAAATCFNAWVRARGGTGPAEIAAGIAQVRAFLEAHGMSRFEPAWDIARQVDEAEAEEARQAEAEARGERYFPKVRRPADVRIVNRVGFRRLDDTGRWEFYAMPEGFREMCRGFDTKALAAELVKAGMLRPASDGRSQRPVKVPGHGVMKLYHLPAAAIVGDTDDA